MLLLSTRVQRYRTSPAGFKTARFYDQLRRDVDPTLMRRRRLRSLSRAGRRMEGCHSASHE